MLTWTTSTSTSFVIFATIANRQMYATPRGTRCILRHFICPLKAAEILSKLSQAKSAGLCCLKYWKFVSINPIRPFVSQVSHHLPILHKGCGFCSKSGWIYSHKYQESRSPGFNGADGFGLLKLLQAQGRPTRSWGWSHMCCVQKPDRTQRARTTCCPCRAWGRRPFSMGNQNRDKTKQAAGKARPGQIYWSGLKSPNKKQCSTYKHRQTTHKQPSSMADNYNVVSRQKAFYCAVKIHCVYSGQWKDAWWVL